MAQRVGGRLELAPMIWIVGLPFAALAAAIIAVRVLRTARRIQDIRATREPLGSTLAHRRPSDVYHDDIWLPMCRQLADAAARRLNRPLTANESSAIWRARSELVLQVALSEVHAATDAKAVTDVLAAMPSGIDRPDPKNWSRVG